MNVLTENPLARQDKWLKLAFPVAPDAAPRLFLPLAPTPVQRVRHVFPQLLASAIISVQPISQSIPPIFKLNFNG